MRRRWIGLATIALVLLTVLSTVTAVVAVNQRNRANEQTTIATARQLAAAAQANLSGRIDLARLLAAEAYRLRPDTRTRSALLQASVASPHLQLFLPTDAKVTSLKTSANGDEFVVGSQDGRVRLFDESGGVRFTVSGVPAPVTVTAIDPSGSWLVAGNDRQLLIWDRNAPDSQPRVVPVPGPLIDVELSGSGQQLAVLGSRATERGGNVIGRVSLFDTKKLDNSSHAEIDIGSADYISIENPVPHVSFSSESMLHVWSGACNRVVLRSPDLMTAVSVPERELCTPANRFIETSSPSATSGAYFILGTVEIFLGANPTTRRSAALPVDKAELLSISRDANQVAVVQSGSIFVAPTSETPPSAADAVRLDGASGITRVEFLRGNRLVSAADGGLQLWDTTAVGPLVQRTGLTTPEIVGFINRPSMELSPDSRFVAVSDEEGTVTILDLTDGKLRAALATTDLPSPVAIAWAPDGRAIIAVGGDGSRQAWRLDGPVPTKSGSWPGPPDSVGLDQVAGAAWSIEGTLYVIDLDGAVVAYNPIEADAKLVVPGQTLSSIGALSKLSLDGRYATRAAARGIDLVELPAGVHRHIDLDSPPLSLEFLGADRLVIGRQDGVLEVRKMTDGAVESVLNIDAGNVDSLATSAETFVSVGLNRDISVLSPESNEVIGRLQLPQLANLEIGTTPAEATAVDLTSDGMTLIIATSGGEVLLWRLNPELEVSAACRTANRNLSADEWLRLVGTDPPADLRCDH